MKIIIAFILNLQLINMVAAQNADSDFKKINEAYLTNKNISMKIVYEIFKDYKSSKPFKSESGELKQNGFLQYKRTGNIETIQTTKYFLSVNHDQKVISLSSLHVVDTVNFLSQFYDPKVVSYYLAKCKEKKFHKENSRLNSYYLEMADSNQDAIKIYFNSKTFFVEKLVMYFRRKINVEQNSDGVKQRPRIEITYYDIELNKTYKLEEFAYDKFLYQKGVKWLAKQQYEAYKVYYSMPSKNKNL